MENQTQENSFSSVKSINNGARKVLITLGGISLMALGALGVVYIAKVNPELLGIKNNNSQTQGNNQAEVDSLVKEVGKLIDLPEGENPTVATVTDTEKVKEQQFFKKAAAGDKVLVYTQSKKAILYRPADKKIIEVGFVNLGQNSPSPAPTQSQLLSVSPSVTITPTKSEEAPPAN